MKAVFKRAFLRISTNQMPLLNSMLLVSMKQTPHCLLSSTNTSFIELLPRIDLNSRTETQKQRLCDLEESEPSVIQQESEIPEDCLIDNKAILQISTFKRKKPKMRKDRARTVRRVIKRKSAKKRAKYNL
jgi:hypothetical protein